MHTLHRLTLKDREILRIFSLRKRNQHFKIFAQRNTYTFCSSYCTKVNPLTHYLPVHLSTDTLPPTHTHTQYRLDAKVKRENSRLIGFRSAKRI